MHIEIYVARIELTRTGEKKELLLCFEVGETEEDRGALVEKFQNEISFKVEHQPYKLLGFVSKKIYPSES
ncbi:MAG: hypothetical protein HYZ14_15420 [Bacteroidetes bacterium]|nr:hypothetical protein [Bacteroidota bacterium]